MNLVHLEPCLPCLPCPMPGCGGECIEIRKNTDDPECHLYYGVCIKCGATGIACTSEKSAVDEWNFMAQRMRKFQEQGTNQGTNQSTNQGGGEPRQQEGNS